MSARLITFATLLALAGCSASASPQAPHAEAFPPPDAELDGAPTQTAIIVAQAAAPEAQAPVHVRDRQDGLWCYISVQRTPGGVRITPVVRVGQSMSGEYSLVITKSGGGGSADISQGGPFDALRGVKQELGASEISLERGSRFRAVLKIRAGGHEVCRDVRS